MDSLLSIICRRSTAVEPLDTSEVVKIKQMSQKQKARKLRGRRDHWLPQGYMRGFIGPSRADEEKPLWCYDRHEGRWKTVATSEIGQGIGFYDFSSGTDYSTVTHPDSVWVRLENDFPRVREELKANRFEQWEARKEFLVEFMHMLTARSPLAMQQHESEVRKLRGMTVTSVADDGKSLTVDSVIPRPLPEPKVRNWVISRMLEDVKKGAFWSSNLHWCLRYTDNEAEPFCTTDQAAVLRGEAPGPSPDERVPLELVHHPESLVIFPLSWQACMFGSPRKFDKAYGISAPEQLAGLRLEQKQNCNRFVLATGRF